MLESVYNREAHLNIYDISEKAGVSIATVSRVLNNNAHVSDATRRKVLAIINESNFTPNPFARGLGLNTMKTVGLLCPDASDPYQANALGYLESSFRSKGYDCLLTCTGQQKEARIAGLELMTSRHVDGIILMGSSFISPMEKENAYIRDTASRVPVILLNGAYDCPNVFCVLCDDERASREAATHLIAAGCRRILCLHHSRNYSGMRKIHGYEAALRAAGIPVDPELIRFVDKDLHSIEKVRDMLLSMEKDGLQFDAVLTSEDILAVGAVKYAGISGKRIPEDLCVMGYNNSSLCLCTEPELSSVDNRLSAICTRIVETMLDVLNGKEIPQKTVFNGELVLRESTRKGQ